MTSNVCFAAVLPQRRQYLIADMDLGARSRKGVVNEVMLPGR